MSDPPGLTQPLRVKGFPWRRRGVLVPTGDRRTAALGICMFTASKPAVIAAQVASFWLVRLAGTRVLPGGEHGWEAPFRPADWEVLLAEWRSHLGPFDAMALYQRRQAERAGLTLLLTRHGRGVAVVKVRPEAGPLFQEQRALGAVMDAMPASFRSPAPLGAGSLGDDVHWSAQSSVFERPHRPVLEPPSRLFGDVQDVLARIAPASSGGDPAAHNDLTPWNLRRDHRGDLWLYDWEDWGVATVGRDRVYFLATAAALAGGHLPPGLPAPAIAHWRDVVLARNNTSRSDEELNARILSALDHAWAERAETGCC